MKRTFFAACLCFAIACALGAEEAPAPKPLPPDPAAEQPKAEQEPFNPDQILSRMQEFEEQIHARVDKKEVERLVAAKNSWMKTELGKTIGTVLEREFAIIQIGCRKDRRSPAGCPWQIRGEHGKTVPIPVKEAGSAIKKKKLHLVWQFHVSGTTANRHAIGERVKLQGVVSEIFTSLRNPYCDPSGAQDLESENSNVWLVFRIFPTKTKEHD